MEPAATSSMDTTLPLAWRLRRALLIALLLGLWAPVKLAWELNIAHQQDQLRYNGAPITRQLRDELGQGLTIGVLSGMRSVVADFVWLDVTVAWMNQDWWRMGGLSNLTTALQPRWPVFWDMGGWELAWNASTATERDPTQPSDLRRLKASRFWIERGRDIYLRGIENNPTNWHLYQSTGQLFDQRLHDYKSAAVYYQKASELPGAPVYLERFPAIMYDRFHLNDPATEYVEWVKLWNRLTPEEKRPGLHTPGRIESEIRQLEVKLAVPNEKRVFPN
jgi:hypothetical protein